MLTVADIGEGGVKNLPKSADVLYGWSLCILTVLYPLAHFSWFVNLKKRVQNMGCKKSGCKNRAIIFQKAKRVTLLVAIHILVCADWLANCITILKFYCAISIFSVDWIQSKHELYLKLRKESIHEIKVLFWVDSGQH